MTINTSDNSTQSRKTKDLFITPRLEGRDIINNFDDPVVMYTELQVPNISEITRLEVSRYACLLFNFMHKPANYQQFTDILTTVDDENSSSSGCKVPLLQFRRIVATSSK